MSIPYIRVASCPLSFGRTGEGRRAAAEPQDFTLDINQYFSCCYFVFKRTPLQTQDGMRIMWQVKTKGMTATTLLKKSIVPNDSITPSKRFFCKGNFVLIFQTFLDSSFQTFLINYPSCFVWQSMEKHPFCGVWKSFGTMIFF
jgi:hypothetical protein